MQLEGSGWNGDWGKMGVVHGGGGGGTRGVGFGLLLTGELELAWKLHNVEVTSAKCVITGQNGISVATGELSSVVTVHPGTNRLSSM